jgi:hypothetical protein
VRNRLGSASRESGLDSVMVIARGGSPAARCAAGL